MSHKDLPATWRTKADDLRRYGAAEAAATLEACARELEDAWTAWHEAALTLEEAVHESGYSRDHLGRLLSDRTLPNAGQPYAPRIRRRDLPRKPGHAVEPMRHVDGPVPSRTEMARSVVNSD